MSSTPIVRFAPSPTGRIHIGNARTAFVGLVVRSARPGGSFCASTTLISRARAPNTLKPSNTIWLGSASDPTCSTGNPSESRSTIPPRSACAI